MALHPLRPRAATVARHTPNDRAALSEWMRSLDKVSGARARQARTAARRCS